MIFKVNNKANQLFIQSDENSYSKKSKRCQRLNAELKRKHDTAAIAMQFSLYVVLQAMYQSL